MKVKYRYFIHLEGEQEREVSEDTYFQTMRTHTTTSVRTPDGVVYGRVKAEVEN